MPRYIIIRMIYLTASGVSASSKHFDLLAISIMESMLIPLKMSLAAAYEFDALPFSTMTGPQSSVR